MESKALFLVLALLLPSCGQAEPVHLPLPSEGRSIYAITLSSGPVPSLNSYWTVSKASGHVVYLTKGERSCILDWREVTSYMHK